MEVRKARTDAELAAALDLRERVFCLEQGVSVEADRDGRDGEATHIVAVEDGRVIGTCRLLYRGPVARLGRLAVEPDRRGNRVGAAILERAEEAARDAGADAISSTLRPTPRSPTCGPATRSRERGSSRRASSTCRWRSACLSCGSTRCPGLKVIVAGERGSRPGAFLDVNSRAKIDPETDPFAAGHEDRTPPEVYALRENGSWRVRVVPNLYPALSPGEPGDATPIPGRGPGRARPVLQRAGPGLSRGDRQRSRSRELAGRARAGAGRGRHVGLARAHARALAPPTST